MGESPFKDSIRLDVWSLRKMFNEDRIAERGESGDLTVKITRSREVTENRIENWMPGTQSQELRYYDRESNLVAKAHRYLRPDGKLAASGLVDPKRVVRNGVLYKLRLPDEEQGS
jgi:hypothetical protein